MPWALIGLRVVLRDTEETEPPLPRPRPALTLQTGPGAGTLGREDLLGDGDLGTPAGEVRA